MFRILRVLGILAALVTLAIAGLYLLVPANERPEDGSADPVLAVRRPIVGFLRAQGIVPKPVFVFRDPILPSATRT